ncbi:MAG TPA: hypothetical protein VL357_02475 [Rariglobus sp.]|jgi:hypothetical protein|nr:hypothetical protein [Rariglobus sp.]
MNSEKPMAKKQRGKRRKLRGHLLLETVLHALANIGSWNGELTWKKLEERIGVTRQAMSRHAVIADAFDKAKVAIKKSRNTPKAIVRREAEERIKILQEENQRLNKLLDSYLERWLMMERNCLMAKVDPRMILGSPLAENRSGQ